MPRISDIDKDVFADAAQTGADNFNTLELFEIHSIAVRIRQILDASITRQQESLAK